MSKKTSKKGRRSIPALMKREEVAGAQTAPAATLQTGTEPSATPSRSTWATRTGTAAKLDLAQEYHYVFADLRKIAIIAVIMFALLFALALVLR